MTQLFGLILAATTAFVIPAMAAAQSDRIRGTIESVDQNSMTVQTLQGNPVKVSLTDATKYVTVVKSSLSQVAPHCDCAYPRSSALGTRSTSHSSPLPTTTPADIGKTKATIGLAASETPMRNRIFADRFAQAAFHLP
jgi:hypothetical protein